ncbi:transmembrane protein 238-like [Dromaius novaehollandiae]|uniref:transmembrane protein 238-like n=1 Tax=Dromaius novaehollandiae TaxID=8790 RepID=UPI00311FCDE7
MLRGCGHCAPLLLGALALDAAGLALVVVGAAARPARAGRPFGDCLVLSGALLLFLSLLGWLLWHTGNLRAEPPPPPPPRRGLLRLARKLSARLGRPAAAPGPAALELSAAEPPAPAQINGK